MKDCKGQGHCPKCGSSNLEYGNTELDGENLGYEFECRECGCEGIEWYYLQYGGTSVDESFTSAQDDFQTELRKCYEDMHLIYCAGIQNKEALAIISRYPSKVVAEILLNVCNRVNGAFRFINTYVDNQED